MRTLLRLYVWSVGEMCLPGPSDDDYITMPSGVWSGQEYFNLWLISGKIFSGQMFAWGTLCPLGMIDSLETVLSDDVRPHGPPGLSSESWLIAPENEVLFSGVFMSKNQMTPGAETQRPGPSHPGTPREKRKEFHKSL